MVKEKRLPVISRQMFRQAHRSFTSDAFNPNKGNPIEFDKQSTQLQLVRVDSWIPEKLMIRFTFRDTLAQGREPVKSTASILFNRPVGDVMQIIPGDVEVERVFDKELGLDSYVPVSKEIIGAVEAINGVSSNKYVFFGYLMMMGEKFTGKEKDLEGLIGDSIKEQVPLLIEGLIGDSIKEQVPLLIAGAWDNLLYKDANPIYLNVATGGDYLENLNGVRTYQGGGSVTVELSNEWSNKGKYSFKGIYGGLTSGEQISFLGHVNEALPVTPGDEITIIINYKSINSVRLGVGWRDNNFTPVKSDYVVLPATPDGGTGSITVTAPAGVEFMIVIIVNTTSPVANTVYVDNIKIKTSEPEPYVPVVTVSGVVPGNGTENVPIDQSIVVTFDDNIEAGSAYANITVKNPGGTSMSINKTISGNKLTITGSWLNNILYTLTIPANGIKDFLAGLTTTFKTVPETPPATQPALPVYGLYVNDTVTPDAVNELTVANLNSRGITDLFILTPLGSIDTRLNPWITKFGSSDIRLHAWVTCFKDSNGWFNPNPSVEPTKLNTIKTHIQTIINDKNVDGINLDSVRYPGSGSLIANNHNGTYHVTEFVKDIRNRVNTHNNVSGANQILLSTCLMPETDWSNKYYYGQSYSDHATYTDFIAPMVYGYDYNFGEGGIEGRTAYIKDKSGKNNTVSTITTYKGDTDTTPLTSTELTNDKAAVQAGGSQGYILFRYGLLHTGW